MSWLGSLLDFERFNLKGIGDKISNNPERLLIGAVDPFSSGVWGKVLGKNYAPMVDQFGGASSDTYRAADAAGIDTGPGRGMHNIAKAVASFYAGNAGGGLLGGNSAANNPALIESAVQTPGYGASSASPVGWSEMAKTAAGYGRQIGDAAGAANQVRGLLAPQQQTSQAIPMQQAQQQDAIGQMLAQQQQLEEMRRQALMQQRGLLYGRFA